MTVPAVPTDGRWAAWTLPDPAPAAQPGPFFPDLPAFVAWLAHTWRRDVHHARTRRWCPAWWQHPEAVLTFDALWRTFETARLSPTGIADWLVTLLHPLMDRLTADDGPLTGCTPTGHGRPLPPLPLLPPPDGLFAAADLGVPYEVPPGL